MPQIVRRLVLSAVVAMGVVPAVQAGSPARDPVAAIKALYAADAPFVNNTGAGVMGNSKVRGRFLSHALQKAMLADEKAAKKRGEPPTIEGDPFVDSQESGARDFKISLIASDKTEAQVLADFDHGDGRREKVTFALLLEHGQWRIDDIAYARDDGSQDTIRKQLGMK